MKWMVSSLQSIYRYRELLLLLVERDLKVRYQRSILGMIWTLLNPLLQMAVYTLVFSTIMRIDIPGFPVFLLSGLLPWNFISAATTGSALSLLNNQGLIRKVAVPQAIYPLSVVGSKLFDLLVALVPMALLSTLMDRPPGVTWVFVLPAIVFASAFAVGMSLFFSSATVFFRDVRHLIDVLFQIWFYLTPIFYPQEFLERLPYEWVKRSLSANPAAPIIRCFQAALYENRFPDGETVALAATAALLSLVLGTMVFVRVESRHIHHF
jgi:lipopolysaccharide transport system permease protein